MSNLESSRVVVVARLALSTCLRETERLLLPKSPQFVLYLPQSVELRVFLSRISALLADCSGLFENGGNITSPRYPNNYPNEVSCKWVLKAPINNTVLLALESFELEKDKKCLYDHVQIYDGDTTDATPLSGNLCGQQLKKKFRSSSRTMLVVFKSDESETRKGFKASWTAELYSKSNGLSVSFHPERSSCSICLCMLQHVGCRAWHGSGQFSREVDFISMLSRISAVFLCRLRPLSLIIFWLAFFFAWVATKSSCSGIIPLAHSWSWQKRQPNLSP